MSSSQQMDGLFKVVDLSMDVPLAPFYLRDPCQGVNIKLEQAVMKYITKLGGVLLAWWGLRFKDASAGIMWELPEIHTSVGMLNMEVYLTVLRPSSAFVCPKTSPEPYWNHKLYWR